MEVPNIVVQIQNICAQADLEQKHSADLIVQQTTLMKLLDKMKSIVQDYRLGLALVVVGVICSCVIPVALPIGIGVGLIVGGIIPTVIGGINELKKYQANMQQSKEIEDNNLYAQQEQSLRDILNVISSQKHELKHEVELSRHITDLSLESTRSVNRKFTQDEVETLLYEFLKHSEQNHDKEHSLSSDPKSRTIS